MLKILRGLTVMLMSRSLIFAPLVHADQIALPSGNLIAPQISHEPPNDKIEAGSFQKMKATVTVTEGIKMVVDWSRGIGCWYNRSGYNR